MLAVGKWLSSLSSVPLILLQLFPWCREGNQSSVRPFGLFLTPRKNNHLAY